MNSSDAADVPALLGVSWGLSNNGKENGNHYILLRVLGLVIMEKKMETTIYCLGFSV